MLQYYVEISFIIHMHNYYVLFSAAFHLRNLISLFLILRNAALCVAFGLSLFAGVLANAIYAANNTVSIHDTCDQSTDIANYICDALRRVRDSEVAAAVSCENASYSYVYGIKHNMTI